MEYKLNYKSKVVDKINLNCYNRGDFFFVNILPKGERKRKKAFEGKGKDRKSKFIHPSEEEPLLVDIGDLRI